MATADDLMISAQRFYRLARVASNAATKLQLVNLGDDYFRQADELRHEEKQMLGEHRPQDEFVRPPL
jgi:DnaJ-domain-containing protein 1